MNIQFFILAVCFIGYVSADQPCIRRMYKADRMVCVCNATYCDTIDKAVPVPKGQFIKYTSSKQGLRFHKTNGSFSTAGKQNTGVFLEVSSNITYQSVIGFGGAFTDSAGINIDSISSAAGEKLLKSYFSPEGIEFNIGRVPIAGCDFSTHTYTYNDAVGDINLTHFKLTEEDYKYKIPFLKYAQTISPKQILLIGASWSAPPWMKTNDDYSGFGFLREEYYQAWADYHIKFLDAYKKEGIHFWAISSGNEPSNGIIPVNRFNSLGWSPFSQKRWIEKNLGPSLHASLHRDTKLLALDDQRFMLPWWINILMSDRLAASYVDGVAVHWYWDSLLPARLLDWTHDNHPDKFIISTEASVGDKPWQFEKVALGSWSRGEAYMDDIIEDFSHWVTGWVDWNLALDPQGGPNWARNFVDAAVIVNATADEFYKQPMFYAVGHFSKFVPRGSVRIDVQPGEQAGLRAVAFQTPDQAVVIVVYNKQEHEIPLSIHDPRRGLLNLSVERNSFSTILYW
ncbi:lysosomal acid glucosylceramidase-like isoform X2 [Bacillus rossius redtenbacheri]